MFYNRIKRADIYKLDFEDLSKEEARMIIRETLEHDGSIEVVDGTVIEVENYETTMVLDS